MNTTNSNTNFPVGEMSRVQLQIMRQLIPGPLSRFQLVHKQDGTLTDFYNAFNEIKNNGWVVNTENDCLTLTELGREEIMKRSCIISNLECSECIGRGLSKKMLGTSDFLQHFKKLLEGRPEPNADYDQQIITPENMMLRAAFMDQRGDVVGKNILIIGDDDMLGIALALTGLPKRVTVLEVDYRINDFINKVAKEHNLLLDAHNFDVREKFPEEFLGKYDVFNCDPVETVNGIKLFFSAGLTALKGIGSTCYFGLTTLEAGTKKWFQIQKALLDMNLVITDIKRTFNEYECTQFDNTFMLERKLGENTEKHMWYWSALWRLEVIDTPKPSHKLDGNHMEGLSHDIYLDHETWATPTGSSNPL